jgi:hypothetical protein
MVFSQQETDKRWEGFHFVRIVGYLEAYPLRNAAGKGGNRGAAVRPIPL